MQKTCKGELTDSEVKSLIYSDRDKFLKTYKQYYKDAPLSQKLFGMGYAGNYTDKIKLIEMDFHDLFFSPLALSVSLFTYYHFYTLVLNYSSA